MILRRLILAASFLLCVSPLAWAQATQPDPWEQQRFRLGALAFTPTIQIKNVGVDTNVFNSVADPKQDFTFTAGPQVDWWLRAGNLRFHGANGADYVYFSKYDAERGTNQSHKLTLEYRLNRIRPYAGGSYLDTRDRPGFEIDARARHTETGFRGGAIIR